jgi:hypothetical protein
MLRLRSFLWLMALVAFAMPTFGTASDGHARAIAAHAASTDCPNHAPPPDPCPSKDTAKHAAGECCPLMSSTLALLPLALDGDVKGPFHAPATKPVRSLAGQVFVKDPPPPRV